MNSPRQDAWTKDEDLILAETVLRYIREGKTQLEAFKEVGQRLSRTPAACGFRWNATIRKQYKDAIVFAKEERKKGNQQKTTSSLELKLGKESDTIDSAISLLEKMKDNFQQESYQLLKENEDQIKRLKQENDRLMKQLSRYQEAWQEMGNLWNWVQENEQKNEKDM